MTIQRGDVCVLSLGLLFRCLEGLSCWSLVESRSSVVFPQIGTRLMLFDSHEEADQGRQLEWWGSRRDDDVCGWGWGAEDWSRQATIGLLVVVVLNWRPSLAVQTVQKTP